MVQSNTAKKTKLAVGNISRISGKVNIAAGNITEIIKVIQERALTAAEEAEKARSIEEQELAEGVGAYLQRFKQQVKRKNERRSPYKGLLEYRLEDAEAFYGRKTAIHDLLTVMDRGPLTILHAESGAGKTSLLQAGIVPRILGHGHMPVSIRPYKKSPSEALKRVFLPDLSHTPELAKAPLLDFLRRAARILGHDTYLYILADQFEEFFIHLEAKEQAVFIEELGECLDDKTLNVNWLITLRTEYHGRLGNFQPRIHNVFENDFLLKPLTLEEARESITEPAKRYRIKFAQDLPDQILKDLAKEKEVVSPPQLQLVCSALFESLGMGKIITCEQYQSEGRASGILQDHLGRVLKRLPASERNAALLVLESLITSVRQRIVSSRQRLVEALSHRGIDQKILEATIDRLVEDRLLRVDEADEGMTYELAHDYLLDKIEMTPEVINRKQAEELLEQGMKNWGSPQKILLGEDVLTLIGNQEQNLNLDGAGIELLFWSAIKHNQKPNVYASKLTEEQKQIIIRDIRNNNLKSLPRIEKEKALWALRKNLLIRETARIGAARGFWWIRANAQTLILLSIAILILGMSLQYLEGKTSIVEYQKLDAFDAQCLAGRQSVNPNVAINIANPSEMMAYDPQAMSLCVSHDKGETWTNDDSGLPGNSSISSISFNKSANVIIGKKLFLKKDSRDWIEIVLPDRYQGEEPSAIAQPINDAQHIFMGMRSGLVIQSTDLGNTWENFDAIPTEGLQTLSSNGIYVVATTPTKIYFRAVSEGPWKSFNPKQEVPIRIRTAVMITPIIDSMRVVTEAGTVLEGFVENDAGLRNINSEQYPPDINTIAAFQSYEIVGTPKGLYYRRSLTFLDSEWWKSKSQSVNSIQTP